MAAETASHTEIEKKYLLHGVPEGLDKFPSEHIRQGYLAIGSDYELRIREKVSNKGIKYTMTFKGGSGLTRDEYEVTVDKSAFSSLWPKTDGKRIEKTRYMVPIENGLTLEVDVYENIPGLVVAEIEFPNADVAAGFVAPKIIAGAKDVTGVQEFANQSLAVHGIPSRSF